MDNNDDDYSIDDEDNKSDKDPIIGKVFFQNIKQEKN